MLPDAGGQVFEGDQGQWAAWLKVRSQLVGSCGISIAFARAQALYPHDDVHPG